MAINLISDSINQIRKGSKSKSKSVLIFYSKKMMCILDVLYLNGLIRGFRHYHRGGEVRKIEVLLKYRGNGSPTLKRILAFPRNSDHVGAKALCVMQCSLGFGCLVISTSRGGVMSGKEALRLKIGGVLLCYAT